MEYRFVGNEEYLSEIYNVVYEAYKWTEDQHKVTFSLIKNTKEDAIAHLAEFEHIVALDDGVVVGTVSYKVKDDTVYFSEFGVKKAYSHMGIGASLLHELVTYAKNNGYNKVTANTASTLKGLIAYYKSNGFVLDDYFSHPNTDYYSEGFSYYINGVPKGVAKAHRKAKFKTRLIYKRDGKTTWLYNMLHR